MFGFSVFFPKGELCGKTGGGKKINPPPPISVGPRYNFPMSSALPMRAESVPPSGDGLAAGLRGLREGFSLPREFYQSAEIYNADLEGIFSRQWIFAAPLALLRNPGDFVSLDVGENPLALVRGRDDVIRGFHNVCRHRGSRIFSAPSGNLRGRKIVCPYHQWTYDLDGALSRASHMPEQPPRETHSLRPVAVAVLGGGVHVCLAENPPAAAAAESAVNDAAAPYAPARMRVALESAHEVVANWKLLTENNRECGHCRGAHPELMACVYDFGLGGDPRDNAEYNAAFSAMREECGRLGLSAEAVNFPGDSFFRIARLPYRPGYVSETTEPSAPACARPMGGATAALGQMRVVALPNCWGHYLSDYFVVTRILPAGPRLSRLNVWWMVDENAEAGKDYDPENLARVWEQTTVQDAALTEENQRGVNSAAYRPGPYSPVTEAMVSHFVGWYARRMLEFLDGGRGCGAIPAR